MGDTETTTDRLVETFWSRHEHPASGWSRVPIGPVLVYAVYRRNVRLVAATLVWTVLNPVVFPPPADDDAWMTRAVRAERWWLDTDGRTLGSSYPNSVNTAGAAGWLVAFVAAWRRRPVVAAVGVVVSLAGKLWWLRELVDRYDAASDAHGSAHESEADRVS